MRRTDIRIRAGLTIAKGRATAAAEHSRELSVKSFANHKRTTTWLPAWIGTRLCLGANLCSAKLPGRKSILRFSSKKSIPSSSGF